MSEARPEDGQEVVNVLMLELAEVWKPRVRVATVLQLVDVVVGHLLKALLEATCLGRPGPRRKPGPLERRLCLA